MVYEIHNLAEILSLRGHKVYAIDYSDTWAKNGFFDIGSLKTKEFKGVSRAVPGASVTLRHPGFVKIPGLSRLSGSINQYREIKKTIKEKHIDVIMLYSVPTNGLQVIHLARKFGIPVLFRSIDMLYRLVRYPALRPATRYIEKKVYTRVDAILAITPNHSRYVISLGAAREKVRLLPMPIDTNLFNPSIDSSEVRRKWRYNEKDRVVVFIGTLFEFSGLDGFIREFPHVIEKVPEAKLLIVGDGPQRQKLEKIIAEAGLKSRVTITGFQPYQTMPQYISLAALCINPFLNTKETRDIFPGKILQYIACGKVAVVTPLLGIKSLIPDESKGVLYADTATDMATKVADLLASDVRRHRLEQAGIDYILQVHAQQKIGQQLEAMLQEIVDKNSAGKDNN
ncbi:MAG: glycosyltransferase family 4 protein [Dehalococcoidales bacterium]